MFKHIRHILISFAANENIILILKDLLEAGGAGAGIGGHKSGVLAA